jgi:catechol 2,3-dioxygenase-like lactoylglutathione lyase family enzyme
MKPISTFVSHIATHVGLTVPDMDEARRFYCDLLGLAETETYQASGPAIDAMTGVKGVTVRTAMLEVPGGSRIQMQTFEPGGAERTAGRMNDHGLTHLSFGVQDVHAEYRRLLAAGVKFRNEPVALRFDDPTHPMNGLDAVYFEDPWGLPLEFVGPTAAEPGVESR